MKKTLTQKQIADYEQLCRDRDSGRLLTPDGLRFICAAYNYDPEAIGQHFLEQLADMKFAQMMEEVAREEGRKALEENERLKKDETFVVPESTYRKCLAIIENMKKEDK